MKHLIAAGLISCAVLLALPGKSLADGYVCHGCCVVPGYYPAPVYYAPPVYYALPVYYRPQITYYAPVPYYSAYYRSTPAYYPHRTVVRGRYREVYRRW